MKFARFYPKGVYISLLRRPWPINTNWVSKPTEAILSQFWRPEIWDQSASRAPLLPKDPGRPPLSVSSFWCSQQSLAFLGLNPQWPWSLQSRSASSHGLLPSVCSNSLLLIRIPVTELWLTLIQGDLLCTWLHLPRPCFQTRLCSQIPGDMNLWKAFFSGSVQWSMNSAFWFSQLPFGVSVSTILKTVILLRVIQRGSCELDARSCVFQLRDCCLLTPAMLLEGLFVPEANRLGEGAKPNGIPSQMMWNLQPCELPWPYSLFSPSEEEEELGDGERREGRWAGVPGSSRWEGQEWSSRGSGVLTAAVRIQLWGYRESWGR